MKATTNQVWSNFSLRIFIKSNWFDIHQGYIIVEQTNCQSLLTLTNSAS